MYDEWMKVEMLVGGLLWKELPNKSKEAGDLSIFRQTIIPWEKR